MARDFSLQILLEHSSHRMEAAERQLRILGHKEEAARQRLEDIRGYKREYQEQYQQRLAGGGAPGLAIHLLRDFHAFMGKVEQAIAHQEAEVARMHAHWQAAYDKWLEQRRQVKAYEALAARHRKETLRREEKREQAVTDELAGHQYHPLGDRGLG